MWQTDWYDNINGHIFATLGCATPRDTAFAGYDSRLEQSASQMIEHVHCWNTIILLLGDLWLLKEL
jgi:hypothetical protein